MEPTNEQISQIAEKCFVELGFASSLKDYVKMAIAEWEKIRS